MRIASQSKAEVFLIADPDKGVLTNGLDSEMTSRMQSLPELISLFNETTERMKVSHEHLARRVAELSKELEVKNQLLERKNHLAALGEMAAGVAHEIRNPLGGIKLYADLLGRDLSGQPKLYDIVRKIQMGIQGLNRIVEDMLSFTRLDRLHMTDVDVAGLLQQSVSLLAADAESCQVQVKVDIPLNVNTCVQADPDLLQRVLINLILNSIQASPANSEVVVTVEDVKEDLLILCADRGPGIPKDVLARIFDPFFTTKKSGTGLGLSIAQQIMSRHGGAIEVLETGPDGTRIMVRISRKKTVERPEG